MKYLIEDNDDTPQRFPLKKLFFCVLETLPTRNVQFHVLRSQGYGLTVNQWDSLLDEQESIVVEKAVLEQMLEGVDEWFYDLNVEVVGEDLTIRFGLHDSTFMYIEGPADIADSIAGRFRTVRQVGVA
jgi:hypothetical protein